MVVAPQECDEQRGLEVLRHRIDRLRDTGRRRRLSLLLNRHGIAQHLARQRRDRRGHRRAEEERLPPRRAASQDPPDVRQEAHVEHPVRFVQHEMLDLVQPRVGERK